MALTSASSTTEVTAPGDGVAATSATKGQRRGKRASHPEVDGKSAGKTEREPRRAAAQKGGRKCKPDALWRDKGIGGSEEAAARRRA